MAKVFFTSDLHFGHERCIEFDGRPFSSVEEMDEELIRRWNEKVAPGDLTYVLGDMVWKGRNAEEIINRLNGQIILIKGNHDRFIKKGANKALFAAVKDYEDICVNLENGSGRRCILSHYFIPMYNGYRHKAIHLHGHSHNSDEAKIEEWFVKKLHGWGLKPEIYNVGCMYWDYAPVTLDEILAYANADKDSK